MANVKIPSHTDAPSSPPADHRAKADEYGSQGSHRYHGQYGSGVDSHAHSTPHLGAGGKHNRPASGYEYETEQ